MSDFYEKVLEGNIAKEIIKVMFEKAGYLVIPYGYESTLSNLRKKLNIKGTKKSRAVRKIRTSPDMLVYDPDRKDLMIVEVKMRNTSNENRVLIYKHLIEGYKEFWNESILVLLIPCNNIFYAQKISELQAKEEYSARTDFEELAVLFPRLHQIDFQHFRTKALHLCNK